MLKLTLRCESCKKETMAFDDGEGILEIDFSARIMTFTCPKCGNRNVLNMGQIESYLSEKTKLPSIGGAR